MAITNEEIITRARLQLYAEGKIGTTGRTLTYEDADGKHTIPEPEEIHTFAFWKQNGYSVKKGQHAVIKLTIWKHTGGKQQTVTTEDGEEKAVEIGGHCFHKEAFFFSSSQVEPTKDRKTA